MGWEPLAASDPVPGDPGAIRAAARRLEGIGDALAEQAGAVKRIDPGPLWVGLAAERFADHRDEVPPALEAAAARCHNTAGALAGYAGALEAAQDQAADALRLARGASGDIDAARDGLDAMDRHALDERRDAERWNSDHPGEAPRLPAPWSGPDWASCLADAEAQLEQARELLDEAVEARDQAARSAAADIGAARGDDLRDPWMFGAAGWWGRPFRRLSLGGAAGADELTFVVTDRGLLLDTVESWQHETLRLAGIDPEAWDPALGLAATDASVRAAWELYARLYADNPEQFLWAGMAKLAAQRLYPGFQDLHVLRRALESGSLTAEQRAELFRRAFPGLPSEGIARFFAHGSADVARDLEFAETTLLEMQRNIFDDLAWQHVAYQQGGLAALERMFERRKISRVHIQSWRDIDSGDPVAIERGTFRLVRHEQYTIIGDNYDAIRDHSPVTWMLTVGMSCTAESPIPGGRPFREVVPYRAPVVPDSFVPDRIPWTDVRIPGGKGVHVDIPHRVPGSWVPLPINNVSIRGRRWEWITREMFPDYVDLVHSGEAGGHIATPLEDLAADRRNIPNWLLDYQADR